MTADTTARVVFSILYNESQEFLPVLVENFLGFTGPESILVINLPVGRELSCAASEESERVFVFNGAIRRHKFGHTLLAGHVETFDYATRVVGPFDFFCSLASNSLLVRRFDLAATRARRDTHHHSASVDVTNLPDHWWWPNIRQAPKLVAYFQETWGIRLLCQNQIEGLFATRADWGLVHAAFREILELGELIDPQARFALEEILPSTLITNFGSGFFTFICHIMASRGFDRPVGIDDLLGLLDGHPAPICAVKWFERSANDLAALAVSQTWSQDLLASLGRSLAGNDTTDLLMQRMILEEVAASLRKYEKLIPDPVRPDAEAAGAAPQRLEFGQHLTATRQLVALTERRTPAGDAATYLFMEDTRHDLRLDISVQQAEERRISIAADAGPERPDATLEGYLYLNPLMALSGRIVRLTVPLPATADQDRAARHIVIRSGPRHKRVDPWHVSDADGARSYYFKPSAASDGDEVWFGIPIFSRCRFEAALDLI